jgi:hypothetical protein
VADLDGHGARSVLELQLTIDSGGNVIVGEVLARDAHGR